MEPEEIQTRIEAEETQMNKLIKEKNRIEKAGGFVSEGRVNGNLNLSRALGDLEYKSDKKLNEEEQLIIAVPDVKSIELNSSDK